MRRVLWFTAGAMVCAAAALQGAIPRLHADGNRIKDPEGNTVVLRGISLIDLGFLQGWQGGAINMINRLTNSMDTQGQCEGWYPKAIRIPIAPPDSVSNWPYPFNPNNTILYDLLRMVVDYCAAKDLYVIIDWHYVANTYEHVDSTSAFWTYMAPRFAEDEHVMYELFNEPINNTFGSEAANWASVKADMQTWINIVRTYAPDTPLLVAGPNWSQAIGPMASNPVSDPIGGNNIIAVSHIYPGHWKNPSWYQGHIETCAAAYPIFMTEWGFTSSGDSLLIGTITEYGMQLMDWVEERGISHTAWVASYDWGPPMFYTDWTLRCGEGEMGCFVKDMLYLQRNRDLPGGGTDLSPPTCPTELTAIAAGESIWLDWEDNAESDLFGYYVYRSLTAGSGYVKLNYFPIDYSHFLDENVVGGITYYYRVTAADDSNNESVYSDEVWAAPIDTGMGKVLREWWMGIGGTAVHNLTSHANYPNNPTGREMITKFEGPSGFGDNYGTRIRGYLHPPTTGNYTFWIAGDDNCQLWLSTDGSPAHAVQIASVPGYTNSREWTKYAAQQSDSILLQAGVKYYIEALHKEGAGGDHVAVAWTGPGISQQVIDGAYLSRWFVGQYGDFTGDGDINTRDFAILVGQWLDDQCLATAGLDLNGDCVIDLYEFAEFARNWLP